MIHHFCNWSRIKRDVRTSMADGLGISFELPFPSEDLNNIDYTPGRYKSFMIDENKKG